MSQDEVRHWNDKYRAGISSDDPVAPRVQGPPASVLEWLPAGLGTSRDQSGSRPRALDLGCGRGRNARALAERGFEVVAVDAAIRGLLSPDLRHPRIHRLQTDLDRWRPEKSRFDLILDVHYLNRDLTPHLAEALVPKGILLAEIRVAEANRGRGDDRPHPFRLGPGEAQRLFSQLQTLRAEEEMADGLGIGRYHFERPS